MTLFSVLFNLEPLLLAPVSRPVFEVRLPLFGFESVATVFLFKKNFFIHHHSLCLEEVLFAMRVINFLCMQSDELFIVIYIFKSLYYAMKVK